MGMSSGGGSAAKPNINVTPLIDVLLVLLIIFMVINPASPSKFEAKVPSEPKVEDQNVEFTPNPNALIVFITSDQSGVSIKLNKDPMADSVALTQELDKIFKYRKDEGIYRPGTEEVEKTVFINAPKSIRYGEVAKVIDAVKAAKAEPIGLQVDSLSQ